MTDKTMTRVNVLAVPGVRQSIVTDHISDKVKANSRIFYTQDIPNYDKDEKRLFDDSTSRPDVIKTSDRFDARKIDNNYTAVYFPDVTLLDDINDTQARVPASVSAFGAIGYNDKIGFPWFAPAGFSRGDLENVVNTKSRLNAADRDYLYERRINPIASFPNAGYVIFGQKTCQLAKSALDRVNVRRMLLEVKRRIVEIANSLLFEPNTPATRAKFVSQVVPKLALIQSQQGVDQFKVICDSSNNSQANVELNRLNGRIVLVPTRAVEFIVMDFIITNSGVEFE
jgi:phage tail sheath protein FI